MKSVTFAIVAFVAMSVVGCHWGDAAMPIICSVRLPDSRFEVYLHGPSRTGEYIYTLETSGGSYNNRSLGWINIDPSVTAQVTEEGDQVYRVQWRNTDTTPYVVVDLKNWLILEDSNPNNERNAPIEPHEYPPILQN